MRTVKAVWVTRSFLDYRIPVYRELSARLEGRFSLIYNADYVPQRCCRKAEQVLGSAARGLRGEFALKLGSQKGFANRGFRFPYQPGLVKAVLDEKPDVLITDGFFQWTSAALWLRAKRGIPHVCCYEKTMHTERRAQWYRTLYRKLAMRWIDVMCCNGSLSADYAGSMGFPAERIKRGNMVADAEGLEQRADEITEEQKARVISKHGLHGTVFLYVGRLIRLKGLRELLAGWEQFTRGSRSAATLLLAGEGPEQGSLERYCRDHRLDNVRFAGPVDYDDMVTYYRCAGAFIIPTLEDNWSLVVPEAMACGLPILCSRYNGCWPELVTDTNGWVFDPLAVEDVHRVLTQAMSARDRWGQMGEQSRAIASAYTPRWAAGIIHEGCLLACNSKKREKSVSVQVNTSQPHRQVSTSRTA
jgi:glycosyltransferase involved in cell wall biosynthesis